MPRPTRTWTRLLPALALGAVMGLPIAAAAREPEAVAHHAPAAGGADEPGESEGEEAGADQDRIVNWWSFDYGADAKDPAHHDWPPPFGWALVNFVVFLGILSKILWQPLRRGWVERHDGIRRELDDARRVHREAQEQLELYRRKVANVDGEVEALLKQLRADADADRARLLAAAAAEATRIREDADHQIKTEIERARLELRQETIAAALAAAERLLTQNVREEDQARLADRYAEDLAHATSTGGGTA